MSFNNLFTDSQAQAGPFDVIMTVQSLEGLKHNAVILRLDTLAVI